MLDKNTKRFTLAAVVLILVAVAALAASWITFGLYTGTQLSHDSAKWGHFGEFIGGLAGTVVALLALIGLAINIFVQARQLDDARRALRAQTWGARPLLKTEWMKEPSQLVWRIRNVGLSPCRLERVQVFVLDKLVGEHEAGDAHALLETWRAALGAAVGDRYPGDRFVRAVVADEATTVLAVGEPQATVCLDAHDNAARDEVLGRIRTRLRAVVWFRTPSGELLSTDNQYDPLPES